MGVKPIGTPQQRMPRRDADPANSARSLSSRAQLPDQLMQAVEPVPPFRLAPCQKILNRLKFGVRCAVGGRCHDIQP